ncbi:prolyl oligopeptidase family serine peptidase [Chitinophaga lutea]
MQRFYALLLLALPFGAAAQQKKDLSPDDYGKWQSIAGTALSWNGSWIGYQITVQEDNDTLYLNNPSTGKRYALEFGSAPSFSRDEQWVAYYIGVSYKEAEKLREQKMPAKLNMGLLHLPSGKKEVIRDVSSFQFSRNGKFLAVRLNPPKENKDKGAVLLLRNLADSTTRTIGNVTDFAFNKKSDYLAYVVESANQAGNSVELFTLPNYTLKVLASDTNRFSNLSWSKEGDGLAFFKSVKNEKYEEENAQVYLYAPLTGKPTLRIFDPAKQAGFPADMRVNAGTLTISDDLQVALFSIRSWTKKKDADKKKDSTAAKTPADSSAAKLAKADTTKKAGPLAPPKPKDKLAAVDVWHWRDKQIQPRQKITYMTDKEKSLLSVWNTATGTFTQLGADSLMGTIVNANHRFALLPYDRKYQPAFKEDFADLEIVNIRTGDRKELGTKVLASYGAFPQISPAGKYVTQYRDKQWYAYNTATGVTVNLTASIPQTFEDYKDDHPATKPPFGLGGWLKDDKEVLLYDEFDIYAVKPDGKGFRKLTDGRADEIVHRLVRVDFENPYYNDAEPLYVSLYGDKSKHFGYGRIEKGKFSRLIYEPRSVSGLSKAREADVFSFIKMDYNLSPEIYTTKGWQGPQRIASTNPQQEQYKWGKSELVSFTNKKGKKMQGALFYPADYQPGKQYPMVVYIYETLSNTVHQYYQPSRRSPYNTTNFTTGGYFVFRPDIVYDTNDPGMSAVDCVVPAVEEVLKTGMIDRNKVGLMGHSWGAYQTSFIITQTDIFKAACAGAPLTNLISMSLAIYWNSGIPDQKIFETSQGRFDGPWYDRMQEHMRNSPIYQAANIKAPLLVAFGDKDGAVDWHQGIEMYGTMRRMEKPHVLLVYADENHGLAKKENQIDYQQRQREWFDHYLLGKPAPKWITDGVPYLDKMKAMEEQEKTK